MSYSERDKVRSHIRTAARKLGLPHSNYAKPLPPKRGNPRFQSGSSFDDSTYIKNALNDGLTLNEATNLLGTLLTSAEVEAHVDVITKKTCYDKLTEEESDTILNWGHSSRRSSSGKKNLNYRGLPDSITAPEDDGVPHLTDIEYCRAIISQKNESWSYPAPLKGYYTVGTSATLYMMKSEESHTPMSIAEARKLGVTLTKEDVHVDNSFINEVLKARPFKDEQDMRHELARFFEENHVTFYTKDDSRIFFEEETRVVLVPRLKQTEVASA
jgi:hypothetical protein